MSDRVPVVLHFRDGRTAHVMASPEIERSRQVVTVRDGNVSREIPFDDLKAVFYVQEGDPSSIPAEASGAMNMVVEFQDGERIRGTSREYSPGRNGFFLFPADRSKCNKIFVVNAAIVAVDVENT